MTSEGDEPAGVGHELTPTASEPTPARDEPTSAVDEPIPAVDERRLHPAATAIEAIRHARAAVAGMVVVIASQGLVRGALIVASLVVIAAVASFLQWRTTRYAVVDGTLRLRTGIFSRKERNIPASRISALDTSRGLLQRIFGVVAVQVQTAGGNKEAEISLRAVSFREAERLRAELGHRGAALPARKNLFTPATAGAPAAAGLTDAGPDGAVLAGAGGATASPAPEPETTIVYAITPRELFVAAITSPSVAVVAAAGAAAFSLGSDALPDRVRRQIESSISDLTLTVGLVLVAIALLAAIVISVVGTILLYGGFQVTRDERRLRVRRGLLTERVGTIPIDRIHGVRVIESPLRQLLGYAALEVEVAGYAGQDEVTRTLIPLVRKDAIPALLPEIVPTIHWPSAELEPIPRRARRRYLTTPLVVAAPFAIALVVAPIDAFRVVALVPLVVATWVGARRARTAGWLLSDGTLALRWGALGRTTLLAESRRLQRTQASVSSLQRRANLGTFAGPPLERPRRADPAPRRGRRARPHRAHRSLISTCRLRRRPRRRARPGGAPVHRRQLRQARETPQGAGVRGPRHARATQNELRGAGDHGWASRGNLANAQVICRTDAT